MAEYDEDTQQAGPDDETVAKFVTGCWESWKNARLKKEELWHECVENYLVHVDESKYQDWPWRSKVADTFSQETADTIASALRNALFPMTEEYFEVEGINLLGKTHAGAMQQYVERYLHKCKFIEQLNPCLKQVSVIGNAPVRVTYQAKRKARKQRVRVIDPKTQEPKVEIRNVEYGMVGPHMEVLDAMDVVFDSSASCFGKTAVVYRCVLPTKLVERQYEVSIEGQKGTPTETSDIHKIDRAQVFGFQEASIQPQYDQKDEDETELLELYGPCLIDGEYYEDQHIVIANRSQVIVNEPCPYWAGRPIFWATYDLLWFTALGKGPLEPVTGTQALINTINNQKVDLINLTLSGACKYYDDGTIDVTNLYLRPGAAIEVADINNIQPIVNPVNFTPSFQEVELLRQRGERSSGASRMDMGQVAGGRRTAYEANIVRQGASSRAMDVTKHIANDFLEQVLEYYVACIQQYGYGKIPADVLPEDALLGQYQVNYLGADMTAMRQFELQQMTMFLDTMGRIPSMAAAINPPELMGELIKLFKIRNKDVVKSPEQYKAELEQERQRMMLEQMLGGGRPGEGQMGAPMPEATDESAALALGMPA